jgi:hypothetical protein
MFSRRGDPEIEDESADSVQADAPSPALTLTQDELDRRVQAETDRREAKRLQSERVRQRRELRDTDPWQYAEQERKEEEAAAGGFHCPDGSCRKSASSTTESPSTRCSCRCPRPSRSASRSWKAPAGLAGRKLVVTESLKALEKHWKAEGQKEAERKLRGNPAFRKQVLAESRGQTVEPDLLPALSGSEADQTVSALLRKHYRL